MTPSVPIDNETQQPEPIDELGRGRRARTAARPHNVTSFLVDAAQFIDSIYFFRVPVILHYTYVKTISMKLWSGGGYEVSDQTLS